MAAPPLLSRRRWLAAAPLAALAGCNRAEQGRVWVGHLARFGGSSADAAERAVDAIELTLEDLRGRSFRVAGRELGVRHVDARTRPQARAEASRLLAVNRVACLVLGRGVEDASEVAAAARSHGAAAVVLGEVADPTLAKLAVLLGADPTERGRMLARYAAGAGKGARAVVLRDLNDPVSRAAADGFAREYRRAGGRVDWLAPGQKGTADPQLVVAAVPEAAWERALGAAQGAAPVLYAGPVASPPADLAERSAGREVWWPTLLPQPAALAGPSRDWAERYEKRFGQAPGADAVLAHDAIEAVAQALREAGGAEPAKLAERLAGAAKFEGLAGAIRREDGRPVRPLFLARYAGGKRLPAEPLPGA